VFVSGCADFWFSDAKPAGRYVKPPAMIRQLLDLIETATGTTVEAGPPSESEPDGLFDALARRLLPDGPVYIGIAPGAGGREKCWPLENFIELARDQAERGRVPVFLLGPDEAPWIENLRGSAPESVFPLQNPYLEDDQRYAPMLTIALAGRLAVAVANDSGSGHMIAAADAPMVSLFGPTSAEKFSPIASNLIVLTAQSHGADQMAAIPVAAVMNAVERILSEPAR
jgi:ADP-heptose:LPS heptosyltransferase